MICDEKLEPASAKEMVKGEADRLDSAFHLGYNMIKFRRELLVFKGEFKSLSPEQYATLMSCFVSTEKSEQATKLKEELMAPLHVMEVGRKDGTIVDSNGTTQRRRSQRKQHRQPRIPAMSTRHDRLNDSKSPELADWAA
ncbi:hypothetical protein BJ912DRAFT_925281 [Pholiota molesta]|nr:hypothetical protein BJ912DRAFT_925281 [Pholiota molesta]